jgi:hypothetical protein
MTLRVTVILAAVASLTACGCGAKLNVSKSFSLPTQEGPAYVLVADPQPRDQEVSVSVEVTGDTVDVFVMKAPDLPADFTLVNEMERKGMEAKALGSARSTKSATVTCSVPANTDYRVVVLLDGKLGAKTQGTVKLTN